MDAKLGKDARLSLQASLKVQSQPANGEPLKVRIIAYTGSPLRVNGWDWPVVVDVRGVELAEPVPLRYGHQADRQSAVGHFADLQLDPDSGRIEGQAVISRTTPAAQDVQTSLLRGYPWQASIGLIPLEVEDVATGEVVANGRTYSSPVSVVRRGVLDEVSVVERGADGGTAVRVAAERSPSSMNDTHNPNPVSTDVKSVSAVLAAETAEAQRQQKIIELAKAALQHGADPDKLRELGDKALVEGWSAEKTELEFLRLTRPSLTVVARQHSRRLDRTTVEAAFTAVLGAKEKTVLNAYGEQATEKGFEIARYGLRACIAAYAAIHGHTIGHGRLDMEVIDLQRKVQASWSSFSLPGALGNAANKLLLESFMDATAAYPFIAYKRRLANFTPHSMYQVSLTSNISEVPAGGELPLARVTETEYTVTARTYGMRLALPRQAIANDDIGAFVDQVRQAGIQMRRYLDRQVVALVPESSDSFYTSARGNRLTSSPLSIANLDKAEAALARQKGPDDLPSGMQGAVLLVPAALKGTAQSILSSVRIVGGTTDMLPEANPWANRLKLVVSEHLGATGGLGGGSDTTWYMLADPNICPAFIVGFVDGIETPVVEGADMPFEVLGFQWRAYLDFGVTRGDYRGAVKATA